MSKVLVRFLNAASGAAAPEYGLIAFGLSAAILVTIAAVATRLMAS